MNGDYYWGKDTDGKAVKLHVDASTNLYKVVKGDRIEAYITDQGDSV